MTRCTYLRCPYPAAFELSTPYGGRPWFGCVLHAPAMIDALPIGQSSGTGTRVLDIRPWALWRQQVSA